MTKRRGKTGVRSALRRDSRSPIARARGGAPRASGEEIARLALTASKLAVGYDAVARVARDPALAAAAAAVAAGQRALLGQLAHLGASMGVAVPLARSSCRERLRWEWLASSARLIDGAPEQRLLEECAALESEALAAAAGRPGLRRIWSVVERARLPLGALVAAPSSIPPAFGAY